MVHGSQHRMGAVLWPCTTCMAWLWPCTARTLGAHVGLDVVVGVDRPRRGAVAEVAGNRRRGRTRVLLSTPTTCNHNESEHTSRWNACTLRLPLGRCVRWSSLRACHVLRAHHTRCGGGMAWAGISMARDVLHCTVSYGMASGLGCDASALT
jgi:hypothetical protein